MLDERFSGPITVDRETSGWTCVIWTDSAQILGIRKAVKVAGTVDGHPVKTALMPFGDGTHMLPIKKSILAAIKKSEGDTVDVHLTERL